MSSTKTSAAKTNPSAGGPAKAPVRGGQLPASSPSSTADQPQAPAPSTAAPLPPSPEQLAIERHAAARQRLLEHVTTAHRHIASEIGAARQRLAEVQAKAWKLGLERRRLAERIAEIDLDLREAEKAEKIEEGAIEAYVRAQARVQPPPELA